jgi:hypothetical protein
MPMICGPAWVRLCNLHQGPEALKGRADPRAPARAPGQAALALRRAEDLRAMRLPGLRRALPERLETLLLFIARRRGEAFFFAVLAMVGSLFLFSLMIFLPNNESTILRRNRM